MIVSMGYFYNHQAGVPTWLADTWAFSFETRSWTLINNGTAADCVSCTELHAFLIAAAPRARYGHSAVVHNRWMYVFGGTGDTEKGRALEDAELESGELWRLHLDTHQWHLVHPTLAHRNVPHPRSLHAATTIRSPLGDHMLVHGGMLQRADPSHRDDTWIFDFQHHRWSNIPGAGARMMRVMSLTLCRAQGPVRRHADGIQRQGVSVWRVAPLAQPRRQRAVDVHPGAGMAAGHAEPAHLHAPHCAQLPLCGAVRA